MRHRRLLTIAASFAGLVFLIWFFFGSLGGEEVLIEDPDGRQAQVQSEGLRQPLAIDGSPSASATDGQATSAGPGGTPSGTSSASVAEQTDRVEYAIGVHDLQGLPPDASPGLELEMWVAWDPPIVEESKLHRLVPNLTLVKLIPPVTPEGPTSALLSVQKKHVERLLWGDRYGRLSVVLLNGPS